MLHFIVLFFLPSCSSIFTVNPDSLKTMPNLITEYGYTLKMHNVTSDDGYITQIFEITAPWCHKILNAILLYPGLMAASESFLIIGPQRALGFVLADECFDVWIANPRGSDFSQQHVNENITVSEYWSFGMEEMGKYDVAAAIDYILESTNDTKIYYVAHSQGCANLAILLSEREEYNDKIDKFIALAPAIFMTNASNIVFRWTRLISAASLSKYVQYYIGNFNFVPSRWLYFSNFFCAENNPFQGICNFYFYLLSGYNPNQVNSTALPAILAHFPTASSVKQLLHYLQLANPESNGRFQKFDHGNLKNLDNYKSSVPPEYKLQNIKIPTYLYYGRNDLAVNFTDVQKLATVLPNLVNIHEVTDKYWTHTDFTFGREAKELVYDLIVYNLKN